jgi:hypothetical protein
MAVVPDRPVRIREFLADGTAYDATVSRYEEVDSVEVLEEEATTDVYGATLPTVYYTAEEAAELKGSRKAVKAAAKTAEANKTEGAPQ